MFILMNNYMVPRLLVFVHYLAFVIPVVCKILHPSHVAISSHLRLVLLPNLVLTRKLFNFQNGDKLLLQNFLLLKLTTLGNLPHYHMTRNLYLVNGFLRLKTMQMVP